VLTAEGTNKNPAELPASRSNSGAGTEKRPCENGMNHNYRAKAVKYKIRKICRIWRAITGSRIEVVR
jgi:hypothetical protein